VKNRSTEQNRQFWSHVEAVAREADKLVPRPQQEQHDESCEQQRPALNNQSDDKRGQR